MGTSHPYHDVDLEGGGLSGGISKPSSSHIIPKDVLEILTMERKITMYCSVYCDIFVSTVLCRFCVSIISMRRDRT